MKAIQFPEPHQIRIVEVPEPAAPGPGQALVRVDRVGICGTDYSGYLGKMPFFSYPRIPGHELGVEVVAVGAGVSPVRPGDRCAVEPYINCQQCYACRRGHTNCCENHQTLGVHCDGGLCPRFLVPARKLHRSATLSYDQLALVETLGIGCHAINRGNPTPAETVLVIGAGPIGLTAVEFAKLSGARTIVMDLSPGRLEFARRALGVSDTLLASEPARDVEALRQLTEGRLADVVIDATGSQRSMSQALEYCAFAGRLVFVGITPQEIAFRHALMHRRELTLLASRNALAAEFTRIIGLIESGRLDTRPWLTHRAAFEAVPEVFESWLKPETGVIKAVVEMTAA